MAKKIQIDIEVNGKMQKATLSAKKLRKALADVDEQQGKVGRSAGETDRRMKGAAKATSNGTKEFAKMSQGMGGLVGAYATVAANVFALSAAFEFLKNAAQIDQLEKAQISFAGNTGVALASVTTSLREASDGMLGFREAAQAAAIGVAKGFGPDQLEKLAVGARKVSAVLGRDFEDAFDRLVRGVSKAEPELLDELGITLRLETATKRYADALGLQADQLTEAQRSQAVLLETQRQLDSQFGSIDAPVNPFIQLKKTFEDIIKSVTQTLLPIFSAFAEIINGSAVSAATVFGALGLSIAKTILPMDEINKGIQDFGEKATTKVNAAKKAQEDYKKAIDKNSLAFKDQKKALQEAAQAAVKAGSKSKTVAKIAAGQDVPAIEMASFKNTLARAEADSAATGTAMKGVFAGVKDSIITNLSTAFARSQDAAKVTDSKFKIAFNNIGLYAKIAGAQIQKGLAAGLNAAADGAGKLVKSIGKLVNILALAGLVDILKETALSITAAAEGVVGSIAKFAGLGNLYEGSGFQKFLASGREGVKDYRKIREEVKAVERSLKATATDASNIAKGLVRAAAARDRFAAEGDLGAARDAERGIQEKTMTALATLDISGLAQDIKDLPLDKQVGKAQAFVESLGPLLQHIPQLREALTSTSFTADGFVDKLEGMQRAAQDGNANYSAFTDQLANFGSTIAGSDLISAVFVMDEFKKSADAAVASTKDVTGNLRIMERYDAVFQKAGITATEFREKLQGLQTEQDNLRTSSVTLQKQQIDTANILNPLDRERAKIVDDIAAAEQAHAEKVQQVNTERALAMLLAPKERAAALVRIADLEAEADVAAYLLKVLRDTRQVKLDAVDEKSDILNLKEGQKALDLQKQILDLQQKGAREMMSAAAAREKVLRYELENVLRENPNASEEQILKAKIAVEKEIVKNRIATANQEYNLKVAMIDMEEKILIARTKLAKAEYESRMKSEDRPVDATITGLYDDVITNAGDSASLARAAAGINRAAAIATADGALKGFQRALEDQSFGNAIDQATRSGFQSGLTGALTEIGSGGSGTEALKKMGNAMWRGVVEEASKRASQAITDFLFGADDPAAQMATAMQTGATQIQTAHSAGATKIATAITGSLATFEGKMACCDKPKPVKLDPTSTRIVKKAVSEEDKPKTVTEGMQTTEVGYTEHNGKMIEEVKVIASKTETITESFGHFTTSLKDLFDSNTEGGFLEKMSNIFMEGGNVFKTVFSTLMTKLSSIMSSSGGDGKGGFLSSIFSMFFGQGSGGEGGGFFSKIFSFFSGFFTGGAAPAGRYGGKFTGPKAMFGGIFGPGGMPFLSGMGMRLGPFGGMMNMMGGKLMKMLPMILMMFALSKGRKMFRYGGVSSGMFGEGGIAKGTAAGYPAILHGTEAVVPLPNGRSIPVEMSGQGSSVNNVSVNVSVDNNGNGSVSTNSANELGAVIGQAVQIEIQKQKRHGGLLSPYGAK